MTQTPPSSTPSGTPPLNTPPNVPPPQANWFYMTGSQSVGPVPMAAMLGMIQAGTISAGTLVWKDGFQNWMPAGAVPEFAVVLGASPVNAAVREAGGALGLTTAGLIIFIVLLFCCIPLCWLPWVIDGLKANK